MTGEVQNEKIQYVLPENYIGVIISKAYKATNEHGEPGYWLIVEDRKIWVSREKFEAIYIKISEATELKTQDVENLIHKVTFKRLDKRTIIGIAVLKTGFRIYATASAIDPKGDRTIGRDLCKDRLLRKVKSYLGFLAQWGIGGLHNTDESDERSKYLDLTDLEDMDI